MSVRLAAPFTGKEIVHPNSLLVAALGGRVRCCAKQPTHDHAHRLHQNSKTDGEPSRTICNASAVRKQRTVLLPHFLYTQRAQILSKVNLPTAKAGGFWNTYTSPCGGAYSQYRRFGGGFTFFRLNLPQRLARARGRVRVLFREAAAGDAGVLLSSVPRAAILLATAFRPIPGASPLVTNAGFRCNSFFGGVI